MEDAKVDGDKNRMSTYLLRDFPDELRIRAKVHAARQQTSLRAMILEGLEKVMAPSSNGKTPDFDSGNRGSTPRRASKQDKP